MVKLDFVDGRRRAIRRLHECYERPNNVTVCIATLFRWNYAPPGQLHDWGFAVLTASDRMITAGDVQYEPAQTKVGYLPNNTILLIAGDYTVHSQALKKTSELIKGKTPRPNDIAQIYGAAIQGVQRKLAEDSILAPLNMNTESFLAQQKDMSDYFVGRIADQLQNFPQADVEALVVGVEKEAAHIYSIDGHGTARCFDDVGFAAIGIGAWHARSWLMQRGYVSHTNLSNALTAIYSAKRAAEVAPGVGTETDINLVTSKGAVPVEKDWPEVVAKLRQIHEEFDFNRKRLAQDAIDKLESFLNEGPQEEHRKDGIRLVVGGDSEEEGSSDTKSADDPAKSS